MISTGMLVPWFMREFLPRVIFHSVAIALLMIFLNLSWTFIPGYILGVGLAILVQWWWDKRKTHG